jgi:glyoxylase-like metal-dependent hydrolase (beta-lactamase superfamily II)
MAKQLSLYVKTLKPLSTLLLLILLCHPSWAVEGLTLQKVTDDIFAIVGELGNRTADNLGNNATFGFVVTADGVVLIDSGGTYLGAQQIDQLIKTVTDKPVITVINTGGQDHRWLGNGYYKKSGAEIIASEEAVNDQKARTQDQFIMLGNLVGDKGLVSTDAVYADKTFTDKLELIRGGTTFMIYHVGQAHTPGDSFIWLPKEEVMFAGDIVYVERMLGVGTQSNSKSWVDVYQAMAAHKPQHLIPGHGQATNLQQANKDTYDYLVFLRNSVSEFMENGGDITDIGSVDQSEYSYLLNYETLAGRNAQQVYTEIEWE